MTNPTPISQHRPQNNDEDREPFTSKNELENIPLVITSAKAANGKLGAFWIIEAVYAESGERVVFTGSKVLDQVMATVKAQNAFPVAAMLTKVDADNPQGYYWDVVDPPGTPAAAPSEPTNGSTPKTRVDEVAEIIKASGLTPADVVAVCAELTGTEGVKVNDLTDDQYAALLKRLREYEVPF